VGESVADKFGRLLYIIRYQIVVMLVLQLVYQVAHPFQNFPFTNFPMFAYYFGRDLKTYELKIEALVHKGIAIDLNDFLGIGKQALSRTFLEHYYGSSLYDSAFRQVDTDNESDFCARMWRFSVGVLRRSQHRDPVFSVFIESIIISLNGTEKVAVYILNPIDLTGTCYV
jgi:hypothetical protein